MKSDVRRRFASVALIVAAILALVAPAALAEESPWGGPTDLPDYVGAPAKAHPLAPPRVPQNPFLAQNPFTVSYTHLTLPTTILV